MVFDAFLKAVDDVLPETFLHFLLAGNAVRRKPQLCHQVHVIRKAQQNGVLVLDDIREFIADDVRQVATGGRCLPGDGADVEALAVTGFFIGGLGALQGVEVVFQFAVDIVQDDARAVAPGVSLP